MQGAGGLHLTTESLLPDAIEDDCRRSGTRREAISPQGVATTVMTCFGLIPAAFVGLSGAWWHLARRNVPAPAT